MSKDNITLFHFDFKAINKRNRRNTVIATVIAFFIMIAIFAITYVIAHNINSNPFYNH